MIRKVLSLSLVFLLLLSAGAQAAMTKGLQQDPFFQSADLNKRSLLTTATKDANVKLVRTLVRWNGTDTQVNPVIAAQLRVSGMEMKNTNTKLLIGVYAPLVREHGSRYKVSAKNINAFRLFTADLARQTVGLPIAAFSPWNEPNFNSMWPASQPTLWPQMSNAGYEGFKKGAPTVPVWIGETAPEVTKKGSTSKNPGQIMKTALCLDAKFHKTKNKSAACRVKLRGDGFAIHPYDFLRAPSKKIKNPDVWTIGNLANVKRSLSQLAKANKLSGAAAKNVHITEFAYKTYGPNKTTSVTTGKYLKQSWTLANHAKVKTFLWYQLVDDNVDVWRSGLFSSTGKAYSTWNVFRSLR